MRTSSKKMSAAVFAAVALGVGAFAPATSSAALVINEVYSGGGGAGATTAFTRDFVELYNTSAVAVPLAGYTLQYASAAGSFTNTIFAFGPGSVIGAGDFLTVATGSAGSAGVPLTNLNTNNLNGTGSGASLSATAGAVRLIDNAATPNVVDLVGYGSTAVNFETAPAAAPTSVAVSLNRTAFLDTNNNSSDFTSQAPTPTAGPTSVANPVPEPTSLFAAGLAIAGCLAGRRRHAV